MTSPRLLLASGSPRRRDLLTDAGFTFATIAPTVAEKFDVDLTLRELTMWNAFQKGTWMAGTRPNDVVLAADTLVAIDGEILGKPADLDEAAQMLRRLSGRTHEVCTAVFITCLAAASPPIGRIRPVSRSTLFAEISQVRFRRLTPARIRDYFSKVDPLDKAGAYAAQGHGAEIIADVQGSFSNVIGLPLEKTMAALRQFGIEPEKP